MPLSAAGRRALAAQQRARRNQPQPQAGFSNPQEGGQFAPPTDIPPAPPTPEEEDGGGIGGALKRGFSAVMENPIAQNLLSGEEFVNTVGGLVGQDELGSDVRGFVEQAPVVGGALGVGFDVAASPLTLLTAGGGGAAASALRGVTASGVRGAAARGTAALIEPVAAGNFAQRAAAESVLGTAGELSFTAIDERLPEDLPTPARLALGLGGAVLGGTTALRTTRRVAPALVGQHVVSPRLTATQEQLDEQAGRQGITLKSDTFESRQRRGRRIGDVVQRRNSDEIMEDAGWRTELRRKYPTADGFMGRLARVIQPDDPVAHELLSEGARRENAHRGWASSQVERLRPIVDEAFEFDAEGRVTNIEFRDGQYFPTPVQWRAIRDIRTLMTNNADWMIENGVKVEEVTGRALADAAENAAVGPLPNPMFGDMVERLGEGAGSYFPREVTTIDGMQLTRQKLDPTRQRAPGFSSNGEHLALMEENMANGIRYEGNPMRVLHDALVATGDRVNARWLSDEAAKFGKTANDYIDEVAPGLRAKEKATAQAIRNKRDSLVRAISGQFQTRKAGTRDRRRALRIRAEGRALSAVEAREMAALDHLDNVGARLAEIPDVKGQNRPRAGARRSRDAAERKLEDVFDRTENVRQELDGAFDLLRDAEAADLIAADKRATLETELANLRTDYDGIRSDLNFHRERAAHPRNGEAFVPRVGGGRSFPEAFARTLNNALEGRPTALQQQANSFNRAARMFMATMDLSFVGIQGLLTLGTHPLTAARAFLNGSASLLGEGGDRFYLDRIRRKADVVDDFLEHDGHWAAEDMAGEFVLGPGSRLRRLPVVGGAINRTNLAFSRTGNLFRLGLWENAVENGSLLRPGTARGKAHAIPRAERRRVATAINSMTGYKNGRVTSWEESILFAPRFFRSQLDTIARAFKSGADADLARVALFRTMLLGSVFTMMANQALGNETDINPIRERADGTFGFNSDFMRIKNVGGQDVSVFGSWDSLLGIITTSAVAGPVEGITRTLRTKASPLVGTIWDVAQGETFTGTPIDVTTPQGLIKAVATETLNKAPFTLQDAGVAIADGELPTAAAFNFFGGKSSPTTPFEEQDQLAQQMFERHWADLTPQEQQQVKDARPDLVEAAEKRDNERAARGDLNARARVEKRELDATRIEEEVSLLRQLDQGNISLKTFNDEYQKIQAAAANQREGIERMLDREFRDSDNPNVQALSGWYDLYDLAKLEGTEVIDWDLLDSMQQDYLSSLTAEQQRFVDERKRAEHSPMLDWYLEAKEYIDTVGYYATVRGAFAQDAEAIKGIDPSIDSYSALLARIDRAERLGNTGVAEVLVDYRRAIDSRSDAARKQMRAGDSTLEDALEALGRISTRLSGPQAQSGLGGGLGQGFSGFGGGLN
jgi:hypothetical protein